MSLLVMIKYVHGSVSVRTSAGRCGAGPGAVTLTLPLTVSLQCVANIASILYSAVVDTCLLLVLNLTIPRTTQLRTHHNCM